MQGTAETQRNATISSSCIFLRVLCGKKSGQSLQQAYVEILLSTEERKDALKNKKL